MQKESGMTKHLAMYASRCEEIIADASMKLLEISPLTR